MQSFIIEGETVLIKRSHLFCGVSSYRKDLNLATLILIAKINYKIILYETSFNSRLQVFY
jgi:hypothetical protein